MKKKKRQNRKTNHHIVPSSRGGPSTLENIAQVKDRDHRYYHALFDNKTPDEIVEYLVNDYWNGQWDHVEKAYQERNLGKLYKKKTFSV